MKIKKLVPEHIQNAMLYPPGRPIDEVKRKFGIDRIVKLNANENSLGPSPMVAKTIVEHVAEIHRYPDNSAYYLKKKLSDIHAVSPEQIITGNGSNELVQFIIMTFILPGEVVLTAKPTFLLYGIMGRVLGGRVLEVALKDFCYDLDAMAEQVSDETKLIFISNPNNPTGTVVNTTSFERFLKKVPDDVIVVMDEAYFEYVTCDDYPDALAYLKQDRKIIILRTFSKAYGLAGLRIGYAIASAELVSYMERIREPFNANSLAQKAAITALDDTAHLKKTLDNNRLGIEYMYSQLNMLQLSFVPTQTNFILINVGHNADLIHKMLLKDGIMVRSMDGFDLNEYIRVTIGLPEENKKFIETLEKVIATIF